MLSSVPTARSGGCKTIHVPDVPALHCRSGGDACNPNIIGWQFVCGTFRAEKAYQRIQVYLSYHNQVNKVLFTDVQLVRDDGESYQYDSEGNLTNAISATEKQHFVSDKNGNLTRMGNISGTAFEYGYNDKNHLLLASNSEGVRYRFEYDANGQPVSMHAEGGRNLGAVIPGRTYYIREKYSGNYLDVRNGATANYTVIQLKDFHGNASEKWKVIDCKDGYFQFEPENAPGSQLDLAFNSGEEGATVQLHQKNTSDAQKWKLHPKEDGSFWISCKGTEDKNGLTNVLKSTEDNQAVQSCKLVEGNPAQMWYFEPADTGKISDVPTDGKTYHIRVRHSGQYLDVDHKQTTAGTRVMQHYFNGGMNQQFRLTAADETYFWLEPAYAPGMVLAKSGKNDRNLDLLSLETKQTGAANQLFRFTPVETGTTKGYAIICKSGNAALDVIDYTYAESADVILTAYESVQVNKWWILEECSDRLETQMEYTTDGRQISKITDARGNSVRYEYDARNRLMTKAFDAKGKATIYTYDANTDHLTNVKKTVGSTDVEVSYTYVNDRLKTITHNGFNYTYDYDSYGNLESVAAAGTKLETITYRNRDGLVDRTTYATGEAVRNEYDAEERLKSQYLVKADGTEEKLFTNTYDNCGNVVAQQDHKNGVTRNCQYDLIGRTIGEDGTDGLHLRTAYDDKNRVEGVTQKMDGSTMRTQYVYGDVTKKEKPGLLYGVKVDGTQRVSYTYDPLTRLQKRTLNLDNGKTFETTYSFVPGAKNGVTTMLVSKVKNGANELSYTYDEMGNILSISENGVLKCSYSYDELNRLVREDSVWENRTYCYGYNNGGNMTQYVCYSYHSPGTAIAGTETGSVKALLRYENTGWKDQLTSYNNTAILYDAMGNPLTYRGMNLTWEKGRQLKQVVKAGKTFTYVYAIDGSRIKKTVDGVETRYYWGGGHIIGMKSGSNRIQFVYDEKNQPVSMRLNSKTYYYLYNVQGDVIGLLDSTGSQVVSYRYNSWGKPLATTDTTTEKAGTWNPFRYRGYCWDEETELYYVGSRYYDPEVCRFISPDTTDVLGAEQGNLNQYNLYAYCLNNPVNRLDEEGRLSLPNWVKVAIGGIVITGVAVATVATGGAVAAICGAALSGALVGGVSGAALGAISGGITDGWQGAIDGACSGFMQGSFIGGITGAASAGFNIATGATTVVGKAHGSILHKLSSNMKAGRMVASGKYSQVGINKALKTMGLNGERLRPDVIGIGKRSVNKLVEVVSLKQNTAEVVSKMAKMLGLNPGSKGKVVLWVRRIGQFLK